jgi:hypothetical protein
MLAIKDSELIETVVTSLSENGIIGLDEQALQILDNRGLVGLAENN